MTTIEAKIQNAASKNNELLAVLSETDHAPPALEQHRKYIADINHEINQLSRKIRTLEIKRNKEHKEHEKYRDSVMKRFAYRVGRKTEKFDAKAEKEEREYFEALQEEHQAKEHLKYLQHNLSEAETQRTHLEPIASRHKQAQAELDELYDSIFEGPTPGFEDEDQKEHMAEQALATYHQTSMQLQSEQQAMQLLEQARQRMTQALSALDEARSASQMDMFGGGMMMDMMERNALSRADNQGGEAQMLVMQAQRMSPHVGALPRVNVAQGGLMGDVIFDNVFSDYKMHQKIKASQEQMHKSAGALHNECAKCQERLNGLQAKSRDEGARLENARVELQGIRSQVFEKVAGGGSGYQHGNQAPPPSYQ